MLQYVIFSYEYSICWDVGYWTKLISCQLPGTWDSLCYFPCILIFSFSYGGWNLTSKNFWPTWFPTSTQARLYSYYTILYKPEDAAHGCVWVCVCVCMCVYVNIYVYLKIGRGSCWKILGTGVRWSHLHCEQISCLLFEEWIRRVYKRCEDIRKEAKTVDDSLRLKRSRWIWKNTFRK